MKPKIKITHGRLPSDARPTAELAPWTQQMRPVLKAFFHAHYFLKLACHQARKLMSPPTVLPVGWAAVLSLHGLR